MELNEHQRGALNEAFGEHLVYEQLFASARAIPRRWRVVVGPTNSGKSHRALARLSQAANGCYLGPLRLLAVQGAEALTRNGVACALHTGDERRAPPGAEHLSATIELAPFDRPLEMGVIDEAQMLGDGERGSAWTAALVGLPARELVVLSAPSGLAALQALAAHLNEPVEVTHLERRAPLVVRTHCARLDQLAPGTALVAFSRREVLELQDALVARGYTTAVVYGNLGLAQRRQQAARFASGEAQILIATDAIGMGLNLPIREIVFCSTSKFNGKHHVALSDEQLRQIAGRAGRHQGDEPGWVSALREEDLGVLSEALARQDAPLSAPLPIRARWENIAALARVLPESSLGTLMRVFLHFAQTGAMWRAEHPRAFLTKAQPTQVERGALPGAPLELRSAFQCACAPVDPDDAEQMHLYRHHVIGLRLGRTIPLEDVPLLIRMAGPTRQAAALMELERWSMRLSLYAWFSWHFTDRFPDGAHARALLERLNATIGKSLLLRSTAPTRAAQSVNARRQKNAAALAAIGRI